VSFPVTIGSDGTGSITLTGSGSGTALISSDTLTIIGARNLERTTDFVTGGDLLASSLNEQLDSQVIMVQQVDEKIDRSLRYDAFDEFTSGIIPSKDDRKGKILQFNETTGDPEVATTSSDIATVASVAADITTLAKIEDGTDATDAIQTVATNVSSVNNFADRYTVSASAPSSPNEGDLWYDTANNILKYYTGSAFVDTSATTNKTQVSTNDTTAGFLNGKLVAGTNITLTENNDGGNETLTITGSGTGITDVVSDTTPQLGGDLDLNSNDITGTGDINITGDITATNLAGAGASITGVQKTLSFTEVDVSAGTETGYTVTGLSSTTKELVLIFVGVSLSDSDNMTLSLGDSVDRDWETIVSFVRQ